MHKYVLVAAVRPDELELMYPIICDKLFDTEADAEKFVRTDLLKQAVYEVLSFHDVNIGEDISEEEAEEIISNLRVAKDSCYFCEEIGEMYFESEIKFAIKKIEI